MISKQSEPGADRRDGLQTRLRRFAFRARRYARRRLTAWRRERTCTFDTTSSGSVRRLFENPGDALQGEDLVGLHGVARLYVQNRFDVLGSGWTVTSPGTVCRGFRGHCYLVDGFVGDLNNWSAELVNSANASYANDVWSLVGEGYVPIDWQRDFKSGYRWNSALQSAAAQIGQCPGTDIKVPWELSKLQHLPQLAIAAATVEADEDAHEFRMAFRNQVLDFIANNPPGFGANWYTAMLAGIRIANVLVALDLFRAAGTEFDSEFESVVFRSVLDHARFIVNAPDWWVDDLRNNHFIANVAGLAAVCAYLPESTETDDFLAIVLKALVEETQTQFNDDGSSTEGSTGYHAFSAEMVAWSIAFVESIPLARRQRVASHSGRRLPPSARYVFRHAATRRGRTPASPHAALQHRLPAITEFLSDCVDDADRLVQIGDNDSGRFLRLHPRFDPLLASDAVAKYSSLDGYVMPGSQIVFWDEDLLCYSGVLAVLDSLNNQSCLYAEAIEYSLASQLIGRKSTLQIVGTPQSIPVREPKWRPVFQFLPPLVSFDDHGSLHIARPSPATPVRLRSYPQFGLYVFRADDLLLHVRCGGLEFLSPVGHPHDDQLAINLTVGGETVISDPGTFVYTAAPAARHGYRSRSAHFVPAWTGERSVDHVQVFDSLSDMGPGIVHSVRQDRFSGSIVVAGRTITRTITIAEDEVVISDRNEEGTVLELATAMSRLQTLPPTAGYGKTMRRGTAIRVENAA